MAIPKLNQTYKNLRRTRQILTVLGKHGFSQLIETLGLAKLVPLQGRKQEGTQTRRSIAERLCLAFEELGPTFIKLGQMIASRPDMVSPEIAKIFQRLTDDVRPVSIEQIKSIVERELDDEVSNLFFSFDENALGAASVAQVHRATTNSGRQIVVKVQRPNVEKEIETDLSILYLLAKLSENYVPELSPFDPVAIVDEFAGMIRNATDFIAEAHNVDAIGANFSSSEEVKIPEVLWELTTKRVLAMEWIDGIPLRDVERLRAENYDLKKICRTGVDAFFRQVFVHGIFHADLHGGNILVLPESRIALVDFGEVGRIGSNAQTSIANIFSSLLAKDFSAVAREYANLGESRGAIDLSQFSDDLEKYLGPLFGRKIRDVNFSEVLTHAATIAAEHQIRLPRELVLIGRVIVTMEDAVRKLDPEFDIIEFGGQIAREFVKDRFRPDRLARELFMNVRDLGELTKTLPMQLKHLFQKLSRDELTVQIDVQNLSRGIQELDKSSNRLAFAIVIAGLVIGSSILTFADQGPYYFSIPIFGLVGYVLAGVLGLGLLFSILRSGRF